MESFVVGTALCFVREYVIFLSTLQVIPLTCFEGQGSDDKYVPIVPGGRNIPLTFHNRKEYVERALIYRMNEFNLQVCFKGLSNLSNLYFGGD